MNMKSLLTLWAAAVIAFPSIVSAQQLLDRLGVPVPATNSPQQQPNSAEPFAGQNDAVLGAPRPLGTVTGSQGSTAYPSSGSAVPQSVIPGGQALPGAGLPVANRVPDPSSTRNMPFGANLFAGRVPTESINANPNYLIGPGDSVNMVIWGGEQEQQFTGIVDQSGKMFLPNIGPVKVGGVRSGQLQGFLDQQAQTAFTGKVKIYGVVQGQYKVGVFVAGFVTQPGRYSGGGNESVLDYLIRAGGIDITRGSFRDIRVQRGKRVIATIDLYDFMLNGQLPEINFEENDRIIVGKQRPLVQTEGAIRNNYLFEQPEGMFRGADLLDYARPLPNVTHVAVAGSRNRVPFSRYLTVAEFAGFELRDQDRVGFTVDAAPTQVTIRVEGSRIGPSILVADRAATLSQVLNYVSVDPAIADVGSLYIRRRSAADQQRRSINDALDRLERQLFTATSISDGVAQIRAGEAKLVSEFINRARRIEPDGRIVVRPSGKPALDVRMEDGDVIVIPEQAQTVLITGEVMMPQTVVFQKGMRASDYVSLAGGYTQRAEEGEFMIRRLNGEVILDNSAELRPGDEIVAMPEVDSKFLQVAKDIMQVIYQIAVSTRAITTL